MPFFYSSISFGIPTTFCVGSRWRWYGHYWFGMEVLCVCVCARVCVCSAANYVVFTLEQHRHLLVVRRRESIVPVPCFFRVCRCVLCTTIRRRQYPTVVSDGTTSRTTTTKNKKRNTSYRKLNKLITTYTAGKIYNPPLNHCSSAYTSWHGNPHRLGSV